MGIKDIEKELKEEIEKTEEKLVQLRQIEAIVNTMQLPAMGNTLETFPDKVPLGRIKRKLKYTQLTQVETKQVIDLWNRIKDMPNMNQQTIISHIAKTLKYPYKKVYNKVYWLKRVGRIVVPQGMFKEMKKTATNLPFYWTEAQKQQLVQLSIQGRLPREISAIMGIDIRVISNKLNRMRASNELQKKRQEPSIPKNPLLNL